MSQYNVIRIQQPAGPGMLPVGQELIYVYSCIKAVQNELNVKYVFYISEVSLTSLISIGQFKTTPNNAGVGMMELSNLMSSYVGADNLSKRNSSWKGQGSGGYPVPIHIIDKYSQNTNAVNKIQVKCEVEYTDSSGTQQTVVSQTKNNWIIMNAYVKNKDPIFFTSYLVTGAP